MNAGLSEPDHTENPPDWSLFGFWVGYLGLCGLFWFVMFRIAEWMAS